jgi:hypothetical protein
MVRVLLPSFALKRHLPLIKPNKTDAEASAAQPLTFFSSRGSPQPNTSANTRGAAVVVARAIIPDSRIVTFSKSWTDSRGAVAVVGVGADTPLALLERRPKRSSPVRATKVRITILHAIGTREMMRLGCRHLD